MVYCSFWEGEGWGLGVCGRVVGGALFIIGRARGMLRMWKILTD